MAKKKITIEDVFEVVEYTKNYMLENMYTKEEGARLEARVGNLEDRMERLEQEVRAMRQDMIHFRALFDKHMHEAH